MTRVRQVGQRTFQQAKLVEQVWPCRVGADSRQHHELRRQCFRECRAQRSDHRLGLRKTGRWIENGRQHREGAVDARERRGERRDLVEIGHRDVAATRRPRRTLGGIANHGTNRQARVAKRARNSAADLAGDSGYSKHVSSFPHHAVGFGGSPRQRPAASSD